MLIPRFAALQQYNIIRPVDWRWQRASHLVSHNARLSRREDDEITLRAARYVRSLACCKTPKSVAAAHARAQDIHQALGIQQTNGATRLELEARLLAGESNDVIADKCSLPITTVEAFEALFFNVAHFLSARDYLYRRAIGVRDWQDVTSRSFDKVLKTLALHGGPVVVDTLVDLLREFQSAETPPADLTTEGGRVREQLRLEFAVAMLPNDDLGSCNSIELHRFLAESAAKWAKLQAGTFVLESAAMLDELRNDELLAGPGAHGFTTAQPASRASA